MPEGLRSFAGSSSPDPAKKQNLCALGVSVVKKFFKLRQTMSTDLLPYY